MRIFTFSEQKCKTKLNTNYVKRVQILYSFIDTRCVLLFDRLNHKSSPAKQLSLHSFRLHCNRVEEITTRWSFRVTGHLHVWSEYLKIKRRKTTWFSVQFDGTIDTDHKPIRCLVFVVSWTNHTKDRTKRLKTKSSNHVVQSSKRIFCTTDKRIACDLIVSQSTLSVHRHLFRWIIVYGSLEIEANVCLHSVVTMNHIEFIQLINTLILCNGARHKSTFTFVYVIYKLLISQQNLKLGHSLWASLNFITITSSHFNGSEYVLNQVDCCA